MQETGCSMPEEDIQIYLDFRVIVRTFLSDPTTEQIPHSDLLVFESWNGGVGKWSRSWYRASFCHVMTLIFLMEAGL